MKKFILFSFLAAGIFMSSCDNTRTKHNKYHYEAKMRIISTGNSVVVQDDQLDLFNGNDIIVIEKTDNSKWTVSNKIISKDTVITTVQPYGRTSSTEYRRCIIVIKNCFPSDK